MHMPLFPHFCPPLRLRRACLAALMLALVGLPLAGRAEAVRGLWLPSPAHTRLFDSPTEMRRQLAEYKRLGFNRLYVVMWNQGRTLYPSARMKALTGVEIAEALAGRDPLRELLDSATPLGLQVVAWLEYGFASEHQGGPGHEIVQARPQWQALDRQGQPVRKNGFAWLNALDPEVQDFLLDLMLELVRGYPELAGIQGDDRLPALPVSAGHNPALRAQWAAEHAGAAVPADDRDPAWLAWRAGRLNDFMRRLHDRLKAERPGLLISMAPSPYPWSLQEYLQDWPTWLRQGWVDELIPQLYRKEIGAYTRLLNAQLALAETPAQRARIAPGLLLALGGGYRAEPALIEAMVAANRAAGVTGEVYFYSEGAAARAGLFEQLYRRP